MIGKEIIYRLSRYRNITTFSNNYNITPSTVSIFNELPVNPVSHCLVD